MAKLWEKGYSLDSLIERFTVGNDYLLDRRCLVADAVGSIAHARMLAHIGLLDQGELDSLEKELRAIARDAADGKMEIDRSQEDGHTAIEERLTQRLGESGKKIHTGRSRNDQVLVTTRLFAREALLTIRAAIMSAATALCVVAEREAATPMAGRTHLQPAMPSTVGLWAASHAESLLDDDALLEAAYGLVNRSPLGAAAGYGVPLPLDRQMVADSLGFALVHHNVLAAMSSRGKVEAAFMDAFDQVGLSLSRFAADTILFSLPEFGYFRLPESLCTGSSIMPQKRNPDGLELLRGKAETLSALAQWTKSVVRGLPSGYNRDTQETKEPLLRGVDLVLDMLEVTELTAAQLEVDRVKLTASMTPELFATDLVMERVRNGESFRVAYRKVAENLDSVGEREFDSADAIAARGSVGAPGNLDLQWDRDQIQKRRSAIESEYARITQAVASLLGFGAKLFTRSST